ncbi:restriction endonuclease subunit S [Francisella sp. TX07-6608]|uniref:restriction endonuclease subunit S n=1 Tax=Francisella sp. TX07-6608 TaxID=573568 RepID=UPI0008F9AC03|nr:restriction endonuclease subunit S [Francisella sp. TX07-6608]OIN84550.1 type I restriction modification DNA specificity domain protein [Francisella sp. TX07-6608]
MSNSELPKGWKAIELGEITPYVNRGVAPKYTDEDGITVINQKCIREGNINLELARVHNPDKKYTAEKQLHLGDILINSTGVGTAGRVGIFTDSINAIVDTHVSIVRLNKEYAYPKFVYYNLRFREKELEETAEGSTGQIELKRDAIKSLNILLPPLPEQKAIAEVLSSLDDKIDLLYKQNQTLEDMTQTLFREWFIERADEGWEEVPLSEVADIKIGRTPPRKEKQWFSNDPKDVKWISIKDMGQEGVFINGTSEYLTQEAVEKFKIPIIVKNTVILSFKMTLGRVKITGENMLSNEAIAHFNITNDKLYNEYLYLFLKTYPYQTLGSTSSIVTSINSAMIKNILIILPDFKVKKSFKEVISPMFEKIQNNQKQIKTLEQTRDTLLPKLMSGQVRV